MISLVDARLQRLRALGADRLTPIERIALPELAHDGHDSMSFEKPTALACTCRVVRQTSTLSSRSGLYTVLKGYLLGFRRYLLDLRPSEVRE